MKALLGILLALLTSFVPAFIYGVVLWWLDRYEKEPTVLLTCAFIWGAVPAIGFSLVVQLILAQPLADFVDPASASLIEASVFAPLTEEIFKAGALLFLLLFFRREIDTPLDGVIYGCIVGLGFGAVENALYLVGEAIATGVSGVVALSILRVAIFGLNHPMFTGLTGWGIALARTSPRWAVKVTAPFAGLALAMLGHALHNLGISFADLCWPCLIAFVFDWGGVLMLLIVIVWTTIREQRIIEDYLADEVGTEVLDKGNYQVACSHIEREIERLGAFLAGDFKEWWQLGRYYRLLTELAFAKHRASRFPRDQDARGQIARLRSRVVALNRQLAQPITGQDARARVQ